MSNIILNTGHFPTSWMKGSIISFHKKRDKIDVQNYMGQLYLVISQNYVI